jgi:predicted AAA+ superfamily ATPase
MLFYPILYYFFTLSNFTFLPGCGILRIMAKEYLRWQAANVKKALRHRRVVVVSGARQTGKTTLTRQAVGQNNTFRTLDNDAALISAKQDPRGFVKNRQGTMVIDEVQKAPALISEIKIAVDNNNRKGQYLLTGSANIQTLPKISDSLAGRITHIRLRPLTVGEMLNKTPDFLERAFARKFPAQIKGYDKEAIFDLAFRGGYPEAVKTARAKERKFWHLDYIESLARKDLQDLENIKRQDALRDLIKILAGWSGKYMDNAKIGGQLSLSKPTLDTYINALELMFVFEKVAPWTRTDYEYVGRKPKFYATDTGLMTSILNWKKEDIWLEPDRSGKLMETFVFQELAAQIDLDRDYALYQYRDYKKHEIDFIIERTDKALLGVEVKAGHSVAAKDFAPQKWFAENIIKSRKPYIGLVLYAGDQTLSFGKNMLAVPIAALWAG